jgi:hypothetical protein
MRILSIVVLLVDLLTASASVIATAASPGLPGLQAGAASGAATDPAVALRPDRFGNLFAGTPTLVPIPKALSVDRPARQRLAQEMKALALVQGRAMPSSQKPAIVCGMTVIPADPTIDAAIRHPIPENGPAFTMRTILPSVCRQ